MSPEFHKSQFNSPIVKKRIKLVLDNLLEIFQLALQVKADGFKKYPNMVTDMYENPDLEQLEKVHKVVNSQVISLEGAIAKEEANHGVFRTAFGLTAKVATIGFLVAALSGGFSGRADAFEQYVGDHDGKLHTWEQLSDSEGRYDGQTAIKLGPDLWQINSNCGTQYIQSGVETNFPGFRRHNKKVIQPAQNLKTEVHDSKFYFNESEKAYERGDKIHSGPKAAGEHKHAAGLYKAAIEHGMQEKIDNETLGMYYNRMAEAYKQFGKYNESIEASEKALKLNPNYPEAYKNLADIYYNYVVRTDKAQIYRQKYLELKK